MSIGVIGVSTAETARFSIFYASFLGLQRPDHDNVLAVLARGSGIAENRNHITNEALAKGADWVLYLDDDHLLRPDTLMKLLAANKDIISAHYTQRQPPFNPVLMEAELPSGAFIYKQLNPQEKGIISVAAAGAGCLLVKRKVLEALEPPYWTLGQLHPASWGDDLHFCSRVRKAGFEIFCDLDNPIGHIMSGVVWPSWSEAEGWAAHFAQDPIKGSIAAWPMPLPGEV